ncbi:MAG: exodeoxyribonuclease V subunit gamma, partial [Myxococcota bacterium]
MIELVYGNGSEALLDALAERLEAARAAGASPLVPVHVVVPNALVERQVELGLAARRGVSAHLRFHRLEAFIRQQLAGAVEQDVHVLGRHGYERRVLDALHDSAFLARPEHAEVRAYLGAAGAGSAGMERRRVQLAQRLGRLFEGYGRSRPELVLAWAEGRSGLPEDATEDLRATERWQRALFLRATGEAAPAAAGRPGARPLALPMLVGRALDRLLAGGVIPGVLA